MDAKYISLARKNRIMERIVLTAAAVRYIRHRDTDDDLTRVIRYYGGDAGSLHLVRELLWTRYIAGCVYQQYYQYGFAAKSRRERLEYIGSYEMHDFLMRVSTPESRALLDNKYDTYTHFAQYYGREVILVSGMQDYAAFADFTQRHPSFVLKPLADHGGAGVRMIDLQSGSAKQIFLQMVSTGGAVLEQPICQSDDMATFHPQSVNTVRIVTYYDGTDVRPMYAYTRIGRGSSRVDNTSAGGMAAAIDLTTGIISTDACIRLERTEQRYACHPDTGVPIKGAVIPQWDDLIATVDAMARLIPDQQYVGWDMAHTDAGWLMIEGNCRPLIATIQMLNNRGIRPQYKDIL